jgi:hypothetical protein
MFANVCTECGNHDLVFPDQIRSLRQTADGFDVRYVCSCGAPALWQVKRDNVRATAAETATAA